MSNINAKNKQTYEILIFYIISLESENFAFVLWNIWQSFKEVTKIRYFYKLFRVLVIE